MTELLQRMFEYVAGCAWDVGQVVHALGKKGLKESIMCDSIASNVRFSSVDVQNGARGTNTPSHLLLQLSANSISKLPQHHGQCIRIDEMISLMNSDVRAKLWYVSMSVLWLIKAMHVDLVSIRWDKPRVYLCRLNSKWRCWGRCCLRQSWWNSSP